MQDVRVPDFETHYRAMASRDQRFDGRFVVAVTSTGVYCRPSCSSRTPLRKNVRFFRLSAAAEAAGFRPCRRCRPDVGPSDPEWNVRGDLVARALRLIASGAVDTGGVGGLARRLAVSERHLHRQLVAEVGVGPQTLAISRRAHVARLLIESSTMPFADVAFAAGYASVRQFNDGVRSAFGRPPSELRTERPAASTDGDGRLTVQLRYREPLPPGPLLAWLGTRALPGIEAVENGHYRRTLRLPHGAGRIDASFDTPTGAPGVLTARLSVTDLRDVAVAVARCREIFDLDADPTQISEDLRADPVLGPLVRAMPGLRVPGCADGFELAVRAVLGQQVSLQAARTFGGRLVTSFGMPLATLTGGETLTHLFPGPEVLAVADLEAIGLTKRRATTLRALAQAVHNGDIALDRGADRDECVAALRALPGIGPWTAGYIAMRALGDPDVLLANDLGLLQAARRLGVADDPRALAARARAWRPWRSYAAMQLWATL